MATEIEKVAALRAGERISVDLTIVAPKQVAFRFWSSSDRPRYSRGTVLLIFVDGEIIYPGRVGPSVVTEQLDSSVTEYLSGEIPYQVFAIMSASQRVTISLGNSNSILDQVQLDTLRNLHNVLKKMFACQLASASRLAEYLLRGRLICKSDFNFVVSICLSASRMKVNGFKSPSGTS